VELDQIGAFESALLSFMNSERQDLMKRIDETGDYNDEIESGLKSAVEEFKTKHAW
jgi:F-type H+/Na+-transporting ATPase subunit alpha